MNLRNKLRPLTLRFFYPVSFFEICRTTSFGFELRLSWTMYAEYDMIFGQRQLFCRGLKAAHKGKK